MLPALVLMLALSNPGGHYACSRKVSPQAQCIDVERKHSKLYRCKGDCFYPRGDGGLYSERVKAEAESEDACVAKLVCRQ